MRMGFVSLYNLHVSVYVTSYAFLYRINFYKFGVIELK